MQEIGRSDSSEDRRAPECLQKLPLSKREGARKGGEQGHSYSFRPTGERQEPLPTRLAPSQPWETGPLEAPRDSGSLSVHLADDARAPSGARLRAAAEGSVRWGAFWLEPWTRGGPHGARGGSGSCFSLAAPAVQPPPRFSRVSGASPSVPRVPWQQLLVLTNETSWQLRWAHLAPAASLHRPPYPEHPRKAPAGQVQTEAVVWGSPGAR